MPEGASNVCEPCWGWPFPQAFLQQCSSSVWKHGQVGMFQILPVAVDLSQNTPGCSSCSNLTGHASSPTVRLEGMEEGFFFDRISRGGTAQLRLDGAPPGCSHARLLLPVPTSGAVTWVLCLSQGGSSSMAWAPCTAGVRPPSSS
ncbi:unnamed protein product, partial [Gulo gulo]